MKRGFIDGINICVFREKGNKGKMKKVNEMKRKRWK